MSEQELREIEERAKYYYEWSDKYAAKQLAQFDVPRLISALREARRQNEIMLPVMSVARQYRDAAYHEQEELAGELTITLGVEFNRYDRARAAVDGRDEK